MHECDNVLFECGEEVADLLALHADAVLDLVDCVLAIQVG